MVEGTIVGRAFSGCQEVEVSISLKVAKRYVRKLNMERPVMVMPLDQRMAIVLEWILKPRGWAAPREAGPVDTDNHPLPWITYPAQSMLMQLVRPEHRVFEFGCGHSSLWWASRTRQVVSVDHDPAWIERIHRQRPENLTLIHRPSGSPVPSLPEHIAAGLRVLAEEQPLSDDSHHNIVHGLNCSDFIAYAATLCEWPQGYFDIICVDGMARSACAYLAGLWVKPNGIVVFDNSDRWQYSNGYEALRGLGFGRIDFFGLGPVNSYEWCTSLFAKSLVPFLNVPLRERLQTDLRW